MKFSSRLSWGAPTNALTNALTAKRSAGARILDLTESNPTRAGIPYPAERVLAAFNDPRNLVYIPAAAGLDGARESVAAYYAGRGQCVAPERILLTSSTSEGYAYLFKLLADPGDQILVPRPCYPLFDFLASMESLRVASYPLIYDDGWFIDFERLEDAITARTRAVVIVNPNNPAGSFLKRDEMERLATLCRAHGTVILSDEVFSDYAIGEDPRRVVSLADIELAPAFCLSGLSKVAGLPQMKLGWIVAGGAVSEAALAMERLELIADTYLSVGTPVQHAAGALLGAGAQARDAIGARVRSNLDLLRAGVAPKSGAEVLRVEGGWYGVVRVPRIRGEEEWTLDLLERYDVLVQPGYFFDFCDDGFLVVSLLTVPENFAEGVRRLGGAVG